MGPEDIKAFAEKIQSQSSFGCLENLKSQLQLKKQVTGIDQKYMNTNYDQDPMKI